MIAALEIISIITACLAGLTLLLAIPPAIPRPIGLAITAICTLVVFAGVIVDIIALITGEAHHIPSIATHISYLISTPLIVPAGFALTYKKLDRWGLAIIGVATLIATFMLIRQVQTLGIPFGYLNVSH
ncbi:hypothetical protein [Dermatophilus congolensis]|uniref:hypothetical protein n=1 Tax=Dermatophilus congolensis TaxID=1863 RepID=UPI001AB0052E|nr:hypothetical protein [Dermatophilus congolensis]MBO3143984.1 hypothetical protein [Dermatophilus congolensis]MBO3152974.1 hypothetical protein [Dermatophilus congolensis]MBO3160014.1 hypothetical protein [Dermatophilus congolensis]MBO3164262.1 hypothetical protein [Dermatophilus congolensis]MBO3177806.1 hypothetical protein [Dermatophilus congolensis]